MLSVSVFAGADDVNELLDQLDRIPTESRQNLSKKYSKINQEFLEHYTLTADIRILGLKIGKMELGSVVISDRDSFSISYDPPFEKWDTRYLSYWLNDSIF